MPSVHHLKLTLKNIKPPIWREFLVPSDIRLDRLHEVIQIVMGWEDCHLHEFSNGVRGPGGLIFGPPAEPGFDLPGMGGPPIRAEKKATLLDLAPVKGSKFRYWYDFGDDWYHDAVVKAVAEPKPGVVVPLCIKAAGACPPEDCGGPWGYANLLAVLRDPKHEEYEELSEWVGDDWDPGHYDIAAVNEDLAALVAYWNKPPRKAKARK